MCQLTPYDLYVAVLAGHEIEKRFVSDANIKEKNTASNYTPRCCVVSCEICCRRLSVMLLPPKILISIT